MDKSSEARINHLTEELHKANMEINRLVLENQEQDFEIHRLKKLVNSLWNDIPVEEYDDSTDDESLLFSNVSPSHCTAERAQQIASAMQETLKAFVAGV